MRSLQRSLVILLGATSTLSALSIDISLPGLPAIASALHAPDGVVQWTISAFVVTFGIAQLVVGPLADRFGRRPVLLAGVASYGLISAGCALAGDAALLVGLRFLQGFAACSGVVCARAIVRDISSDVVQGATRQAYLSAISSSAPILAPLLGAGILALLGWRWLYGALAVAGVLLTAFGAAMVPETRPAGAGRSGIASAYARVLREPRTVPLMMVIGGSFLGYFGQISGSSFALERQMHLTAGLYAVAFACNASMLLAAFLTSSRAVPRFGPARVLSAGMVIAVAGSCIKALTDTVAPTPVGFVLTMMVCAYGVGLINSNAIAIVLAQVKNEVGLAAGLTGATMFLGASIGSALAGALPFEATRAIAVVTVLGSSIALTGFLRVRPQLRDASRLAK